MITPEQITDFIGAAPHWQTMAACRGMNPDLFFPERGTSQVEAKAVCMSCPVSRECLDFAMESGEHTGIWGGTSERKRREMARKKRRVAKRRTSWGRTQAQPTKKLPREPLPALLGPLPPDPVDKIVDILRVIEGDFQ